MESHPTQTIYRTATFGRRILNFFIDSIIYQLLSYFAIFPLIRLIFGDTVTDSFWISYPIGLFILIVYYTVFEALFQRTPGKFITGTIVIMDDGSKPTPGVIIKRTLIRFVPVEPYSIYTGQFPGKKGTWWHDRWSSTRVVRKAKDLETQIVEIPQPVVPIQKPAKKNSGLRTLIIAGIVFLVFVVSISISTFYIFIINIFLVYSQSTGNFWEDIFPLLVSFIVAGAGIFGIVKLALILRKTG